MNTAITVYQTKAERALRELVDDLTHVPHRLDGAGLTGAVDLGDGVEHGLVRGLGVSGRRSRLRKDRRLPARLADRFDTL
jgi:hypothetical protein